MEENLLKACLKLISLSIWAKVFRTLDKIDRDRFMIMYVLKKIKLISVETLDLAHFFHLTS